MQKLERVTQELKSNFATAKLRISENVIKFNYDKLTCVNIITLHKVSMELACDLVIKRSGTGLAVIISL